ncbi:DUF2752 domain-containing protein [Clostridium sp. AM58-1XD]|uniref:DUF2752 domain-containing protein n=1 Tax=Clostridium sp. AM58-1XD TaxID=2292307 RepID=UPI001A9A5199|nr:DUF2752 domain-containing protein [Clostridium sp. AM58-1XD]
MKKNRWFILLLILAAYVAVTSLTIGCPIRYVTGIPCPGCGMTRAFLSLLSGHVREAFSYHPLFWAVPVLFYGVYRYDRKADRASIVILGLTAAMFLAVWLCAF